MTTHRLAFVLVLFTAVACTSRTTGNEGNFEFSYPADDNIADFNKPIAVGARLDLMVRSVGDRMTVDLSAADFDDPGVLDVESFEGHEITIIGMGDGNALLEVEGTVNGQTLTDSVNMLSRVPEVVELRHTCTGSTEAAFLTGQRIYVPFDMEMANSQPVIGYGYYPVTSSDATALAINEAESGQALIAFDTGNTPATLTLDSDLDNTSLDIEVADEGQISDIEEPLAFVIEDIDVGDVNSFYVRPMVGTRVVCQGNATKSVASDTPGICAVRDREPENGSGDLEYEYGWFEIEGVAEGECLYTVTFSNGANGAGVSAQFSFPIQP